MTSKVVADLAAKAEALARQAEIPSSTVSIRFRVSAHVEFGQQVFVVGSEEALGGWKADKAVCLKWSEGDHWMGSVDVPRVGMIEYKYIVRSLDGSYLRWEECANHRLVLPKHANAHIKVFDEWGGGGTDSK